MKCVCSGCMPCYIGVHQCGLWRTVRCVCVGTGRLCGDWRFVWGLEGCVGTGGLCGDWRFVWGLEVCVRTGGLCEDWRFV